MLGITLYSRVSIRREMTKFGPIRNIVSYDVTYKILINALPTSVWP